LKLTLHGNIGDVAELTRIGKLYEKVKEIKSHLVLIAGFIDLRAYEAAAKLGTKIRSLPLQVQNVLGFQNR